MEPSAKVNRFPRSVSIALSKEEILEISDGRFVEQNRLIVTMMNDMKDKLVDREIFDLFF